MARQGGIREGEIPPFEDDAPRQDAPHIPEGSQQDRPVEGEGSHGQSINLCMDIKSFVQKFRNTWGSADVRQLRWFDFFKRSQFACRILACCQQQ